MHQPPDNLRLLMDRDPQEAEQIIRCYERVPRYARKFKEHARLHVGFSGSLLEQLRDPTIVDSYRSIIDIPAMLDSYARTDTIELIGMGYYHPLFPLIPSEDWDDHLCRGRQMVKNVFGRAPRGFWPSEIAFCMEMVPALVKAGYEYVIVDSLHLQRKNGGTDIYRPYRATVNDISIIVIPCDRDLSDVQRHGTDAHSFFRALQQRVQHAPPTDQPRLITTWSDGENGGWFRQMHEPSGFFGHFFVPFMEEIETGRSGVQPISISDFVSEHPPMEEVYVHTEFLPLGAGPGVSHGTASHAQTKAVEHIRALSARYQNLASGWKDFSAEDRKLLDEARTLILQAETSCFLAWGEEWLEKLYGRARQAESLLHKVETSRRFTL
jgi:hypothetical protein